MSGIYVASKVKHAEMWKRYRAQGWDINSTWIDEARDKESPSLPDLWLRCVREASAAEFLVAYIEAGEVLKGALVEIGAALAAGRIVVLVGTAFDGSWVHHPRVVRCNTLDEFFSAQPKRALAS